MPKGLSVQDLRPTTEEGERYVATISIDALSGWVVEVEAVTSNAPQIVRLTLVASDGATPLNTDHMRAISPRAILEAMFHEWQTEGEPLDRQDAPEQPSSSRFRRDDDYFAQLSLAALLAQRRGVRGVYRRLAEMFDRTEGQITNDLHAAVKKGWLDSAKSGPPHRSPGLRLTKRYPNLATKDFAKGAASLAEQTKGTSS
ncbi:MAG: hypothetical protein F2534_16595 [Actinobacteria bacterium]|uniref:Unannotated protein n=1 Tax=freshwater metagenome TaxID=449393 RepID=A0A6J6F8D0_9ZZZZ|nr:hypothetical protein [Actinomycetota bacterium]